MVAADVVCADSGAAFLCACLVAECGRCCRDFVVPRASEHLALSTLGSRGALLCMPCHPAGTSPGFYGGGASVESVIAARGLVERATCFSCDVHLDRIFA